MRRRVEATAIAIAVVLAGCSSSKPDVQTPPPSAPTSSSSSTPSPSPSQTTISAIPTPTVAKVAQPAVDAYVALAQLLADADLHPATADLAKINRYLTPSAQRTVDAQYRGMARAGIAYRGEPDDPNLKVVGPTSLHSMLLASCPTPSKTNPAVQYYIATGKPVPTPSPPPPAYRKLITMQESGGLWKLAEIVIDKATICARSR